MTDRWLSEVVDRLEKSKIYLELKERAINSAAVAELLSAVNRACYDAFQRAKMAIRYLGEYTLHDGVHLFCVLDLMERLIPPTTLKNLSPLELALLILSAFFHDIGMSPAEDDVAAFKKTIGNYHQDETSSQQRLANWIRTSHAARSERIVREMSLNYQNANVSSFLAPICASHCQDASRLLDDPNLQINRLVGQGEYVNEVFVAVVLRLADILDFDVNRTPPVLFKNLSIRDPVSIREWRKHMAVVGRDISPGKIAFSAECESPATHKAILEYVGCIERELKACSEILARMHGLLKAEGISKSYQLNLPHQVDCSQIRPKVDRDGNPLYEYHDIRFTLDQEQIIKLLMGTSLYGNPVIALRELIQNAVDTCRYRKVKEQFWGRPYQPLIEVRLINDGSGDVLEVSDNGMGMDEGIIKNYFAAVGKSYYRSKEFESENIDIRTFSPISKFGIGFLSVFMVADEAEIETRRLTGPYQTSDPLNLRIENLHGIFWVKKGKRDAPGTTVRLRLKENHPFIPKQEDKPDQHPLLKETKSIARHLEIPVKVVFGEKEFTVEDPGFVVGGESIGLARSHKCIDIVPLELDDPAGLKGKINCVFLKEDGAFTDVVELGYEGAVINGEYMKFYTNLRLATNAIEEVSNSWDGYDIAEGFSVKFASQGRLSIKGIGVEDNLFLDANQHFHKEREKGTGKLWWPFPVEYDLDLSGAWEINLTASRDKIVYDAAWEAFKLKFAEAVASALVDHLAERGKINELLRYVLNKDDEFTAVFKRVAQKILVHRAESL